MVDYIRGFFEEHRFLSNFFASPVTYDDEVYSTVEHAFQAAKFDDLDYRETIRNAGSPGQSKRLGRTRDYPLREGWDSGLAVRVMAELVLDKFVSNPELGKRLLATGDAILVETNDWGDDIWGDSTTTDKPGRNQLGIILMNVRAALQRLL
jgi:ribA/ribD-fused uncharacterized protein